MQHLFDKNDRYTSAANELDTTTNDVCQDIFHAFARRGYSVRDISKIMQDTIRDITRGSEVWRIQL